ncbi:hypothetical protein HZS_7550 [Henneguya salminicola]|nr:hypothetical protein HZS_7550 [Henneguya salminicola]
MQKIYLFNYNISENDKKIQKPFFCNAKIENSYLEQYKKLLIRDMNFQDSNIKISYKTLLNQMQTKKLYKVEKSLQAKIKKLNYSTNNKTHQCIKDLRSDFNIHKSIYNKSLILFCKPSLRCNTVYYKNCSYPLAYAAKFMIDDRILVNDKDCLKLYENNRPKVSYRNDNLMICHIEDSRNGELILASDNNMNPNTIIWKYNISQIYSNLFMARFSNENKHIFGINLDLNINIHDINYTNVIREYKNDEANSYDLYNTIELNYNDSLILYNGDLYCVRSGKKIHTFDKLTRYSAGIFMPFDNRVLIHNQLFDLRSLRVLNYMEHLNDIVQVTIVTILVVMLIINYIKIALVDFMEIIFVFMNQILLMKLVVNFLQ